MREEGAGRSGEHTGERGGPFSRSAGTTTHLHEARDFTMLRGEERGGERAREKGPDWRGRGRYSQQGREERGR